MHIPVMLSTMLMLSVLLALFAAPSFTVSAASRLQDTGDKLVVVIDPGHGGGNRGTTENNHEEKSMTMITARAMYEELQKYEGIEVYLTRTEDVELSLEERAAFAASVDADMLFSIHYNASLNHELYGSEIWVPLSAPFNGYGVQFGYEYLTEMRNLGLAIRGIKTRPGDNGDYYGIIRHSMENNIPAVILEHCHVDNENDAGFCKSDADLKAFGVADATAVAKYFGLKSTQLQADYSDYSLTDASLTSFNALTKYDETEPDVCEAEAVSYDAEKGIVTIQVAAADYDTPLMYYSYSLDGGNTFCDRKLWDSDTLTGKYTDTFLLELELPKETSAQIIVRAYNPYDLYTDSNLIDMASLGENSFSTDNALSPSETGAFAEASSEEPSMEQPSEESLPEESAAAEKKLPGTKTFLPAMAQETEQETEVSFFSFLKLCLIFAAILLAVVLVSQTIIYQKRRQKRRRQLQARKEEGDRTNHNR